MNKIGNNVRITVARGHRPALARMFTEALGCSVIQPPGATDMEVFLFEGGGIGAYYVDDDRALTPAQARDGAWLEFLVADPEEARVALAAQGIEPFEYHDREHLYFAAPGGQVFRLAALAPA